MAITTYTRNCLICQIPFDNKYGKFCSLSCSNVSKNSLSKQKKVKNYLLSPSHCIECKKVLPYEKRKTTYCSRSCSATANNNKRDYRNFKPGPKKGFKPVATINYTKITSCEICDKYYPSERGKTCSDACKKQLISKRIKQRIYNGWNPNTNRGRHKRSYMESSFEDWVKGNFPKIKYISEHPFKRLDKVKTYFADFYFPELSLVIELDGTQHEKTKEYDKDRDHYISSVYNVNIIRISHKEYKSKSKLILIKQILEQATGLEPATFCLEGKYSTN